MSSDKDQQDWWLEYRNLFYFAVLDRSHEHDPAVRGIIICCDYINRIVKAQKEAESSGETHLISRGKFPSEALVNWMITWLVEEIVNSSLSMPEDLAKLIVSRLPGVSKGFPLAPGDYETRSRGIELIETGKRSYREIAKTLGVNVSTVSRWAKQSPEEFAIKEFSRFHHEIFAEYNFETNERLVRKP